MEWDESKHPRDKRGRFTDVSSLAFEFKPNPEIQDLNKKSVDELKNLSIKSSNNSSKNKSRSEPINIGYVNFSDEESVINTLKACEMVLVGLPYEVNITVTTDGRIWQVNGDSVTVDPGVIPRSLEGSYSYHNHPSEASWYSFSRADVAFFLTKGEQYSKASDDRFEYIMIRTSETKNADSDSINNEYDKAFMDVCNRAWNNQVDMDIDGYHETMVILGKVFNFYYERKNK